MLAALKKNHSIYIMIVHKDTREFGVPRFGPDYGQAIYSWILQNYREMDLAVDLGSVPLIGKKFGIRFMVRIPDEELKSSEIPRLTSLGEYLSRGQDDRRFPSRTVERRHTVTGRNFFGSVALLGIAQLFFHPPRQQFAPAGNLKPLVERLYVNMDGIFAEFQLRRDLFFRIPASKSSSVCRSRRDNGSFAIGSAFPSTNCSPINRQNPTMSCRFFKTDGGTVPVSAAGEVACSGTCSARVNRASAPTSPILDSFTCVMPSPIQAN